MPRAVNYAPWISFPMSEKLLIECSRYPTLQQKTPALSTEVRGKSFLLMADTDTEGAGMYEVGDRLSSCENF